MKRLLTLAALFMLLTSHELFLKTDSYFVEANSPTELFLYNGTFDTSENTITRDRIVNAKIEGPGYRYSPVNADYHDQGNVTYLRFQTGNSGTYVAGISTLSRSIDLSGEEFTEYLKHEGLSRVIEMREKKGISNSPARERYSKHVKAILQVAEERTVDYSTELGYPIEFVPLDNPYALSVGDEITFKLLLNGRPIPNQVVHYSSRQGAGEKMKSEDSASTEASTSTEKNPVSENSTLTDNNGFCTIKLHEPGMWYIATIHMVESESDDIDYVSNWATLTFEVR